MEEFAKVIAAVAALAGAVAWPIAILSIVYVFRTELRAALNKIPLDKLKKATFPGVAVELERVADAEAESANKTGNITPRQYEAATRIAVRTKDIGIPTLLGELDRLCLEYDSVRRTMPSGDDRTSVMTRIIVKMRSLAPSLVEFIDIYKGSGSPGSRLAAIAMMQMVPREADLDWLRDRFATEKPFLTYHAALALQNVANLAGTPESKKQLREIAQHALATIKGFAGVPDRGTVEVLEALHSSLPEQ
jgi:hypothetical protein